MNDQLEKERKQTRVLVLGGRGFIGRHAVKCLHERGAEVIVGTRSPSRADQIEALLHRERDWPNKIESFDVVLNCVGILRQRIGETYDQVHHLAPSALAQACARKGVRFVHVSALGLSDSAKSRFITSKVKGERGIQAAGGDWAIARLSLLDGEGGYGAAWLRGVAKLPFFFSPTPAQGEIAALTADDAGCALAALCLDERIDFARNRFFELGGMATYTFEDYIRGLRKRYADNAALALRVPGILARAFAHVCDLFHFSPFSFGHWELLCRDNVPMPNRLPELLGKEPDKVI